jgi:hypothetical protein
VPLGWISIDYKDNGLRLHDVVSWTLQNATDSNWRRGASFHSAGILGFAYAIICNLYYDSSERGKMRQCRIELRFSRDGETVVKDVAIAQPLLWNGYQIHMSQIMGKDPLLLYWRKDHQMKAE